MDQVAVSAGTKHLPLNTVAMYHTMGPWFNHVTIVHSFLQGKTSNNARN